MTSQLIIVAYHLNGLYNGSNTQKWTAYLDSNLLLPMFSVRMRVVNGRAFNSFVAFMKQV